MKKLIPTIVGILLIGLTIALTLQMGGVFTDKAPLETSSVPQATQSLRRTPCVVTLSFMALPNGDGQLRYPSISGCAFDDEINRSIRSEAATFSNSEVDADKVICTIYYNNNGIFSFAFYSMNEDNEKIGVLTLSYDCDTGAKLKISDVIANSASSWSISIADTLNERARSLVLLSPIKPIDDERLFYITGDGIVLVYRLYEIATYSAGIPEFEIAYRDLMDIIGNTSLLYRVVNLEVIDQ